MLRVYQRGKNKISRSSNGYLMVNNNKHISYLVTKLTRNKGKKKEVSTENLPKQKGLTKRKLARANGPLKQNVKSGRVTMN